MVQNHFIEYLREDLGVYRAPEGEGAESKPAGSLLGGDEKVGIERLIESLQCCMWSSMVKKVQQPTIR